MSSDPELSADFHLGYFAVGAILFARSILACAAMRRVPFLPATSSDPPTDSVLAIVVARRADDLLRACLDGLARQGCVESTVVVDDRSPSPSELQALCSGRDDVHLTRVEPPTGQGVPWTDAFVQGIEAASGQARWILLLERPCRFPSAEALARALRHADLERASVVWLVPRSSASPILAPARLTALADAMPAMAATNGDHESVHLPGMPCLGRRETIESALRDPRATFAAVFESRIAALLRGAGRRARCVFAADEMDAGRTSWPEVREGIERLLATMEFRTALIVSGLAFYGVLWVPAIWGAFSGNAWGLWAACGLASIAIPAWLVGSATRTHPIAAIPSPLWFPLEAIATLWLAMRAVARGAVSWRGRTVSLERLREAQRSSAP